MNTGKRLCPKGESNPGPSYCEATVQRHCATVPLCVIVNCHFAFIVTQNYNNKGTVKITKLISRLLLVPLTYSSDSESHFETPEAETPVHSLLTVPEDLELALTIAGETQL